HGSRSDLYNASAPGRICKTTAFKLSATQRSSRAIMSCCCSADDRSALGQFELPTLAIHAARNSRGAAGGGGGATAPGPAAVAVCGSAGEHELNAIAAIKQNTILRMGCIMRSQFIPPRRCATDAPVYLTLPGFP